MGFMASPNLAILTIWKPLEALLTINQEDKVDYTIDFENPIEVRTSKINWRVPKLLFGGRFLQLALCTNNRSNL